MNIQLDIKCVHTDIEENVTMNLVEDDDDFVCFECPVCKRQTIIVYKLKK